MQSNRSLVILLVVIVLLAVSYTVLNSRSHRTAGPGVNDTTRTTTPAGRMQDSTNEDRNRAQ
jgi:hypothetical protein